MDNIDNLEIRRMIREDFESSYGAQDLPNYEQQISLVGELRDLVANKNYKNKAFSDTILEKLYWTVIDSCNEVKKEQIK